MAAMQSSRGKLSPYLANRRAQMEEYVKEWEQLYPDTKVFLPQHIPGHRNVADLGTRGLATPADVDLDSEWQCAPSFVSLPVSNWPITKEEFLEVPEEELIPKFCSNTATVKNLPPIMLKLRSIFSHFEDFDKCVSTLARVLSVR